MRLAVFILAMAAALRAQPPATIQQLFSAKATTGASSEVTNVGQPGHAVYLSFANAAGHTCSTPAATAQLEYSFDDSNWFAFGTPTTSTTVSPSTSSSQTYIGGGSFKFIRFNITAFDTTNCTATAWYVGTAVSPFQTFPQTPQNCLGGQVFSQPLALVPNTLTSITSTTTCVNEMVFNNSTASGVTITVQDGNGLPLLSSFVIPGNSNLNLPLNSIKLSAGIKWQAGSANAIYGAVSGAQ